MLLQYNEPRPECCYKCKFYQEFTYQYDDTTVEASYGECRRYPPKQLASADGGFPLVEEDVWCGEFQSK